MSVEIEIRFGLFNKIQILPLFFELIFALCETNEDELTHEKKKKLATTYGAGFLSP